MRTVLGLLVVVLCPAAVLAEPALDCLSLHARMMAYAEVYNTIPGAHDDPGATALVKGAIDAYEGPCRNKLKVSERGWGLVVTPPHPRSSPVVSK